MYSDAISSKVREILDRNIVYATVLNNDLISPSKLSHHIMPELAFELGVDAKAVKIDTVVKAVTRYLSSIKSATNRRVKIAEVRNAISKGHIVVRSDLAVLCSKITAHLPDKLSEIISYLYTKEDHIFHSSQASTAITLVFDECELSTVERIMKPEHTLYVKTGCAAVKVIIPSAVREQPGIFAYVLNLVANAGINVLMVTFSNTEMILIVDKKDEIEAFKILKAEIDKLRTHPNPPARKEMRGDA